MLNKVTPLEDLVTTLNSGHTAYKNMTKIITYPLNLSDEETKILKENPYMVLNIDEIIPRYTTAGNLYNDVTISIAINITSSAEAYKINNYFYSLDDTMIKGQYIPVNKLTVYDKDLGCISYITVYKKSYQYTDK